MIKEFNYAIFKYTQEDEKLVLELNKYIEENANIIYDFFSIEDRNNKPIINIIPTKIEFDKEIKELSKLYKEKNVPDWVIGFYASNHQIYYVSLNDYKNTIHKNNTDLLEYKKTVLHEFVHYVIGLYVIQNNSGYPYKVLDEGIAQYLSHQKDDMNIEFNYTLNDIIGENTNYTGWYLVTKYILDNNSNKYFLELLTDKNKAQDFITDNFDDIKNMNQVKR